MNANRACNPTSRRFVLGWAPGDPGKARGRGRVIGSATRDFDQGSLWVVGRRIPDPGGSQGSPAAGPRRLLIGSWLGTYLVAIVGTGLSESLDIRFFAITLSAFPVVLFVGLGVLGQLTPKVAWIFLVLWLGMCGAIIWGSLLVLP